MRMDYNGYYLKKSEVFVCICQSVAAAALTSWVLYRSVYGMLTLFLFIPVCIKREKNARIQMRKEELLLQFKDAMQSVSAALGAGYSMENAWKDGEKEIKELYGEDAVFFRELHQINTAVAVNQPLEKLLYEFAARSGCEDIESFAEIFLYAKRSGGDFHKIIRTSINQISDKIEVEKEVQTVISAKKFEQNIMNAVPAAMLVYLNLTSAEFLAPLYGNLPGAGMMTAALAVYLAAIAVSKKIMRISV